MSYKLNIKYIDSYIIIDILPIIFKNNIILSIHY